MDDLEALARRMWIACNGDGVDPSYWEEQWPLFSEPVRRFWCEEARKLRAGLAGGGLVFVPVDALAHGYHVNPDGDLMYKGAPAFSDEASGGI